MTAYRLLWELVKHVLHGRGKDTVYLSVDLPDPLDEPASGELQEFTWEGDLDRFCVLTATLGSGA